MRSARSSRSPPRRSGFSCSRLASVCGSSSRITWPISIYEDGAVGKKRTGLNALHRDHPDKDTGAVGQHVEFERLIDILDKGRLTKVELEHLSLCVPCSVLLRKLHEFASDSGEKGLSGPERLAPHPDHLGEEIGTAGQHVEVERLTAYYEGRMTAAEREELQEHLSLCVRCSVLLRELQEFAADSGERGLSGPESLEQDAWELLAQSRPVGTTERPMPLFPFVQHFFSEASADLLDAVFHPFARKYEMTNPGGEPPYWGRIAAGRSVSVVGDSRHAWIAILPPAATLRDEETCPATIFLREGTVNSVRIPVQEGGFTVTLS